MSYLFSEENQDGIASLFDSHNAGRLLAAGCIYKTRRYARRGGTATVRLAV